jgi:hypothetical protein
MAPSAYWKGYLKLLLACPSGHQLDGRLAEQHEASGRVHWCVTTGQKEDRTLTHGN